MIAQRSMQTAMRRMAVQRSPLLRTTIPSVTATQARLASTESTETKPIGGGASEQLIQQRLRRPVAPHLTIYKPQITWIGSSLNRITGSVLSGGFYIFGFSYLISPLFGWHLDTATMVSSVAAMGAASKFALKFPLAFFATYHSFNGIRHLVWDTGKTLSNKAVQRTGWFVVATSVVASGYLAMLGA